jgi:hypothetical protein
LVEEKEARRRANVLLMRQMNNSCMLVAPAGTPAPPQNREAGDQTPVEATPATGHGAGQHEHSERLSAVVVAEDVRIALGRLV